MKENAIILTAGILDQGNAKTAHGLIRNTSRYNIIGVIDNVSAGKDAGVVLDNIHRGIHVYGSLSAFLKDSPAKAKYAIVGVAFGGGKLPKQMAEEIKEVVKAGISVVSGLHDFLSDHTEITALAAQHGAELIDIRKPRPKGQLKFWTGDILQVRCPVIGVLGTDCALGKRTTAGLITAAMNAKGYNTHMIFTGQTGWLQGHKYGFILDSTYNDFISGELENAVVSCFRETHADVIFVEGQSALSNPSGPCGAEYLMSAQCKGVILQHSPAREFFHGQEGTGIRISLDRDLAIIQQYGAQVIAITLNTSDLAPGEAIAFQKKYEEKYNLPVVLPLEQGVDKLVNAVIAYSTNFKPAAAAK